MMGIKKEFFCRGHGRFESIEPICPEGCNAVEQRFYSPASVSTSGKTKRIDHTLSQLALNFGFTDLSNKNGSVAQSLPVESRGMAPPQDHPFAPTWGNSQALQMARAGGVDTTFASLAGPNFSPRAATEIMAPNTGGWFDRPHPVVVASDGK